MRVKIGKKNVLGSDDQPIMVLFDKSELEMFKGLPPSEDIFYSFPSSWTQKQAQEWLESHKDELVGPHPAPPTPPPRPEAARPPAGPPLIAMEPPWKAEGKKVEDDELFDLLKPQPQPQKPKKPVPKPEPEPEPELVSDDKLLDLLGAEREKPAPESSQKSGGVDLKATFEVQDGHAVRTDKENEKEKEDA